MKHFKRLTLLTLSAVMALSIGGCSKKDAGEEQKRFDEFINQEFVDNMQQNYLNAHIYLENPEDFGIDKNSIDVQIDKPVNEETFKEIKEETKKSAEAFAEFDRDLLSDEQKETYDIYSDLLDINQKLNDDKFDYTGSALESMTGIHTQLPTIFADWVLRDEQDVKDVITLIKNVRPYMQSVLEYTKKQEEKGTLMVDIASVKEYCEKVVKEDVNSSVLTGLNKSIDKLKLDDKKTKAYKEEVKKAFQESFLPAYQDIIKTMDSLDASKNNTMGLCKLKDGKEYYELLFRQASGTDTSIDEIKKELTSESKSALLGAQSALSGNTELYEKFISDGLESGYDDFSVMMKNLEKNIENDFPSVGALHYEIAPIGEDLASGGIAAYFNLPAIDGTTPKQIRVNMMKDTLNVKGLETFSTVAHEGIPGHMYQTAYAYKNLPNPWRKVVAHYTGYQEGYATYVELYSLKYLDTISEDAVKVQQYMTIYQDYIVALMDIGIHYEGWTKTDAQNFLEENGLSVTSIDEFYNQIQANPTAFISYYVGHLQFNNLKKEAQKELGDAFNDKDFHEAILRSGAAPFHIVEKNVKSYIEANK